MDNSYDGPKAERRKKRERDFEYLLGKALEHVLAVGKLVYKAIEEIDRKVDGMEVTLQNLETTMDSIEATESEINTNVVSAGERFKELVAEIENLPSGGGSVTQEQVDAITTRAQAVEGSLTAAASTLASDTPAAKTPAGGGAEETKTSGTGSGTTQTATLYTYTSGEGVTPNAEFTVADVVTAPTDGSPVKPLYAFAGDSAPGDEKGAQIAGYAVYSGPTEPTPVADGSGSGSAGA